MDELTLAERMHAAENAERAAEGFEGRRLSFGDYLASVASSALVQRLREIEAERASASLDSSP